VFSNPLVPSFVCAVSAEDLTAQFFAGDNRSANE
jgi:hypothetical protein